MWRGWRLVSEEMATWPEVKEMSLEEVDLQNMLLDSIAAARKRHERSKGHEEIVVP